MKLKSTLLYITAATLTFSSCQIGKHYTRPELNLPEQLDSTQQDTLTIAEMQWWEIYTDTTLQNLIDKTLEHNKDIKMAAARVKELAAMKRIDFANLFPQLNGSVYTQKEASNYGGDKYRNDPETGAKATVSWEVDLWGNLRWAKDKSMADFLGSIEAQRALKMSLIAEVAQAYFELVALDNELAIVKQTLNAREEGLTSETSYQQAQVEYARTATLVPDLERKISIKENDIAFLAGEYPKQIERSIMPDEVKLPESLPIGLPSTLLERRPDVRQAEQRLIAANAAGKNRAIVKAKKAAYEQECYNYEKSVLTAFKDARNAIVDFNKIKEIYESRLQLERSSKTNMELAQLQYINGVIGYLDVLDAQRSYFDAQIGLSNAVRDKHHGETI